MLFQLFLERKEDLYKCVKLQQTRDGPHLVAAEQTETENVEEDVCERNGGGEKREKQKVRWNEWGCNPEPFQACELLKDGSEQWKKRREEMWDKRGLKITWEGRAEGIAAEDVSLCQGERRRDDSLDLSII